MTTKKALGMAPRWRPWDQRWEARYLDEGGIERSVTARVDGDTGNPRTDKGRKAVLAKKRDAESRLSQGLAAIEARMTVAAWSEQWLTTYVDGNAKLADRTKRTYRWLIVRYINPHLGARQLATLTPVHVQSWLNDLAEAGLGDGSRRMALVTLRSMLRRAKSARLIDRNPASVEEVDTPTPATPEFELWTPEEAAYFLDALPADDWFRPVARMAIMGGLRNGEVCGLAWSDLTLDPDTLTGVAKVAFQTDPETHRRVAVKTKGSKADVPLAALVVADLLWWRKAQRELQILNAREWTGNPDGFVFTTRTGAPQRRRYLNDTLIARVKSVNVERIAAGLPPLRHQWFHALRHQAATFQYVAGARDREVTEFMRHAPGSKVTQRYIHLGDEYRRAAADRMNSLFPVPPKAMALPDA